MQTPTLPVAAAYPWAACPAPCSWRTRMCRIRSESNSGSYAGRIAPPGMPKTFSAPAHSSDRIRLCAPVTEAPAACSLMLASLSSCSFRRPCRPNKKPLGPVGRRGVTRVRGVTSADASGTYENRGTHGPTVSGAAPDRQAGIPAVPGCGQGVQYPTSLRRLRVPNARPPQDRTMAENLDSDGEPFAPALDRAHRHARRWLESLADRAVPAGADADAIADGLGRELPSGPCPAEEVVDLLASAGEPGLVAMPSGRFFGFVIGGSHPAALAADWLVSAWDQNAGLRQVTPGVAAAEEVAATWLLELLGLPRESGVGFVTGATTANFTAVTAARDNLLRGAGWDIARGLAGGPRIRVLAGRERHDSVDLALRYAGLPSPEPLDVDREGRVVPAALEAALGDSDTPALVLLQAGNLHSGACDPFTDCIATAQEHGAWVHVDGAFGLWAAASPAYRHLTAGIELADSWATDAHKTLNVPYDCGIVAVRDAAALNAAMGAQGDYFIPDAAGDPMDRVPEMSRRGRGVSVWAALRASGRDGVAEM